MNAISHVEELDFSGRYGGLECHFVEELPEEERYLVMLV